MNSAKWLLKALPLTLVVGAVWPLTAAKAGEWTLESAARRALEVAPEMRAAEAEVAARKAELVRDTAWPNPTAELRADSKLGLEDGRGGTDATQLAVTQPLPLLRLSRQRAQAEASFAAAQAALRYRRLLLENQAARAFHQLQLAEARRTLARERAEAAQQYAETGSGARDRLVRYLAPLDRTRLTILRESARQALAAADGEWREAVARFRRLLALPADSEPKADAATPAAAPAPRAELEARLDRHPALAAASRELDAARAGISVARSGRFADPTVTLFRERDILGGVRRDYNGVVLGVQVPLWNLNRGPVDRAVAEASRAEAESAARRREIETALHESHLRHTRLAEQTQLYSANVLEPSRRFLDLTRRSFAAGETGVLALLDANNNYFDASQRYLELLAEAAFAAADLRLAAGEPVTPEVQP